MNAFKYSINTNGLRKKYSPAQIVAMAKKLKVDGIEWGLPPLAEAGAAIREMDALTRDAGLEVAGYINGGKLWKKDEMRRWANVVSSVGGKSLRVAHPWIAWNFEESLHQKASYHDIFKLARDAMPAVVALSKASGVRFLVEMHSGALTASALAAANLFQGLDPRRVGVIYDPANTLLEGSMRPRSEVEVLGKYLAYVHAKNLIFLFDGKFKREPVPRASWSHKLTHLPYGMVDYVEIFFALHAAGFRGYISSEEYFQDGDDQFEQLRDGIAFLKECAARAPARPEPPYTTFND
jgi:sugar phosphate isomerase/epimerase